MFHKINGVNNIKINVEDLGEGKPVVFLHGWPVNHNMFEYQFTELLDRNNYRCIGIDLRGFGESDKPKDGYNYNTMSDDVKAVLDTLDIKDATLIGFSMGGAIAIRYITRHKAAHVNKLILLGAAAPCFTKRNDFHFGIEKSAVNDIISQTYSDRPTMLKNFSHIFFKCPDRLSTEFNIWNLSLALSASAYATIQCALELRDADLRADLDAINIPTLILHGIDDHICLFDLAKVMHQKIKNSKLVPIANAGHGFYFEDRELVNSEIIKFIG